MKFLNHFNNCKLSEYIYVELHLHLPLIETISADLEMRDTNRIQLSSLSKLSETRLGLLLYYFQVGMGKGLILLHISCCCYKVSTLYSPTL